MTCSDTPDGFYKHAYYSVEQDANRRAKNYFGNNILWDYEKNPIYGSGQNEYLDAEYGKYYTHK